MVRWRVQYMSYTFLKVSWQAHNGTSVYGDYEYSAPVSIIARKQQTEEIVQTTEGKELLSKHVFYVEPNKEPNALFITEMDKLDNELVLKKQTFNNIFNEPKLLKFITV